MVCVKHLVLSLVHGEPMDRGYLHPFPPGHEAGPGHTPSLAVLMPTFISSVRVFPKSFPRHFWCRHTDSQLSLSEGQRLRRQASSEGSTDSVAWITPQFLKNLLCSCLFFLVCFETNIRELGDKEATWTSSCISAKAYPLHECGNCAPKK